MVLREPQFRLEFPLFSREKGPNSEETWDLYEPLLIAMAQVQDFPF